MNREKSEDRENEALMILILDSAANPDGKQLYEWEPAGTLTHIIRRGLDYPRRSFTVYLKPGPADINSVILSFTADNQLILGLSIAVEDESPRHEILAEKLLKNLAEQFQCHLGMFCKEEPPPRDEKDFTGIAANRSVKLYSFERNFESNF